MSQKIILATDHAGFELKEAIKAHLQKEGYEIDDCGALEFDKQDDYPDFIIPAAEKVAKENAYGIIMGGSGQGEALAANKVKGARAALYYGYNKDILTLSKEHNNANILSLGARFLKEDEAIEAVTLWLNAKFSDEERHVRRIKKITDYE